MKHGNPIRIPNYMNTPYVSKSMLKRYRFNDRSATLDTLEFVPDVPEADDGQEDGVPEIPNEPEGNKMNISTGLMSQCYHDQRWGGVIPGAYETKQLNGQFSYSKTKDEDNNNALALHGAYAIELLDISEGTAEGEVATVAFNTQPSTSILFSDTGGEYIKVIEFNEIYPATAISATTINNFIISGWNTENVVSVVNFFANDMFAKVKNIDISTLNFRNVKAPCTKIFEGITPNTTENIKVSKSLYEAIKKTSEDGHSLGGNFSLSNWNLLDEGNVITLQWK